MKKPLRGSHLSGPRQNVGSDVEGTGDVGGREENIVLPAPPEEIPNDHRQMRRFGASLLPYVSRYRGIVGPEHDMLVPDER